MIEAREKWASVSAGALIMALGLVGQARAQTQNPTTAVQVDEVVVTAQRRSENLQDVPVAVTALGAEQLRSQGVREARDLQNIAPGLSFRSGAAASSAVIFIRGVGTADFNANNVGAVGVYVDDIFVGANSAKLFNVFDSAGVEVLRGPQGTLYGRNTTGGAIKFASHLPDAVSAGEIGVSYGRFNDLRMDVGFGGPIIEDRLKVRVAGFHQSDDGTTLNTATGHRVNNTDLWAGRAILDFTPNDDLLMRLIVHGGENRGGARQFTHRGYNADGTDLLGYADTDGSPWRGAFNVEGREGIKVVGASLKVEYSRPWGVLTSATAYEKVNHTTLEDTDASPNSILTSIYDDHPRQWSQELRFQSHPGEIWNWSAGAFYFHDDLTTDASFDLLRDLRDPTQPLNGFDPANSIGLLRYPFSQTTVSGAAFVQADYRPTPALKLTAGVRYTHDKIDFDYDSFFDEQGFIVPLVSTDASRSFDDVSFRLAADYELAPHMLAYGSVSTGYNAGGFSGGAATDPAQLRPFDSEALTAYEAGLKLELFGRRLRVNTSAFYYDYKDLQVFVFDLSGPVPVQRKTNAGAAALYGLESEITARLPGGLTVGGSLSALHAEYDRFSDGGADYGGHKMVNSPELSGSVSLAYLRDLGGLGTLNAHVTQTYQSRYYLTPANEDAYSQGGYGLLNARVELIPPGDHWTLALWARNVTSRRYIVDINPIITLDQLNYGDPARYGLEARYSF